MRLIIGALIVLLTCVTPTRAQHLRDGDWIGRIIHLTGRAMEVVYQVRNQPDGLDITMEVDGYGPFEFERIRATRDSLRFTWEPSFELACALARLDGGVYQGACMDPWGGFGGIVMAPPGSDVDTIALHDETIESIAGWTAPPPGDTLPDLGDTYPLGQTIMVQGRKANMVVAGEGPVTVILEAGLGDNLASWERLQKLLAQELRVVAYDRAGLGYSEASGTSRTPEQVAVELRGLLRVAGIPPPYVLVAHAEGAFYARRFAALYRDMVQALVLVDPHLESRATMWSGMDQDSWQADWGRRKAFYERMPAALRGEFQAYAEILERGILQGADTPLRVPLTVLSARRVAEAPRWVGERADGQELRLRVHADWTRAEGGTHIPVLESGSYIHQEFPMRVFQAIQALLQ